MKRSICLYLLLFLLLSYEFKAQGIEFTNMGWEEVLAQAQEENKMIFVDAYADWCGPCKAMSRSVFPDPILGQFYNKHFINVKANMEKGKYRSLSSKYNVQAYPTLLFLSPRGEVIRREKGSRNVRAMMRLGQSMMENGTILLTFRENYKENKNKPDFLYEYASALFAAEHLDARKIGKRYLKLEKDWTTEQSASILLQMIDKPKDKYHKFLLENIDSYVELFGEKEVRNSSVKPFYLDYFKHQSEKKFRKELNKNFKEKGDEYFFEYMVWYALVQRDIEKLNIAAAGYFKKYDCQEYFLLKKASEMYAYSPNYSFMLPEAEQWLKKSIGLKKTSENVDLLSLVCFRLGKEDEALALQHEAIQIADHFGTNHTPAIALFTALNGEQ